VPAAFLVGACASYPQRTAEALGAFQSGDLERAAELFADPETTGSAFLSGAEAGTVLLANGDWEGARSHLARAAEAAREFEDRTLASPSALGEGLMSWVLSESAAAYEGEGYERVMLHAMLAMTYLAQGNLDGVWVEVRRANQLLENEEKLYSKSYRAGGLGHFLSATAYELLGEYDQAYIDYERMHEKGVGTELAGHGLLRLADRLGYDDDLSRWSRQHGAAGDVPLDAASIVVIAGVGLGPFKQDFTLPIQTPDGLLQWSVPTFAQRPQAVSGLVLRSHASDVALRTSRLEEVGKVAHENLEDRLLWLSTKSAVRALAKRELTEKLEKDHGLAGRLAGDLFTFITERADLRAWQTLPDSWQGGRLFVAAGEHELVLDADGGEGVALGRFRLEPGETLIVLARSVGHRLFAYAIGGQRLDGLSKTSAGAAGGLSSTP
jgi:hypothetical protein